MATILFVEDEEVLAWVMAHVLRKAGHTRSWRRLARPRSATRAHPDLIVLDLGLPDLAGA